MKYTKSPSKNRYDYIIGGAGLAGLTLAYKLWKEGFLEQNSLLIIDPDKKETNDRTWSFWAKEIGNVTQVNKYSNWNNVEIKGKELNQRLNITPYKYYSIEGLNYYSFIKSELANCENIEWLLAPIESDNTNSQTIKTTNDVIVYAKYYFPSQFTSDSVLALHEAGNKNLIWQHFYGEVIESEIDCFNKDTITYMDMNVEQNENGLAFIYILPYSSKKALVEYTLFSKNLLNKQEYINRLHKYLEQKYAIVKFKKQSEEFSKIPMSVYLNEKAIRNKIPIGTLSGTVKASTGYSFVRVQKQTDKIIDALKKNKVPLNDITSKRHLFYDKVLLDVILKKQVNAQEIFQSLYLNNRIQDLMKFLDEETSFLEEVKIMLSVPKWEFTKSALKLLLS